MKRPGFLQVTGPNLFLGRRIGIVPPAVPSGAAPFPWSPAVLNPLIWLDASRMTLSNGDPVAEFTDFSGNGNHFVQATTVNKPTFVTNGINGLPSVDADGVDDSMTLAAIGTHAEWWAFVVFRFHTLPGAGVVLGIDDYNPDASYQLLQATGTNLRFAANVSALDPGLVAAAATDYAMIITGNSSEGNLYTSSLGNASKSGLDYSRANGAMRLFARGDGHPSNCCFAEFAFGSGSLSVEDRAALFDYSSSKWGTAIP